jgi:hypothetical protein
MIVLNNICKKCNKICNSIHFQHKFIDWTSDNNDIDKFIQDTQLSTHGNIEKALEWVSYDRFHDIEYIAKNEFDNTLVYRANWIDGDIRSWDNKNQNWRRTRCNMFVNLKSLNIPNNLTLEFVNKV